MRRIRARAHAAGLAAIAATVVVAPLLVSTPAEARLIPKAELSISKAVADHGPTVELNPALSNTGLNGHLEWVEDGLRIYTEADLDSCVSPVPVGSQTCNMQLEAPEMRITEYIDTDTPLSQVVNAPGPFPLPYIDFAPAPNTVAFVPSYNLLVDGNDDGNPEYRFTRDLFSGDWSGWTVQGNAPFTVLTTGNPPQPTNVGPLSDWLALLTPNPQQFPNAPLPTVTAFGFTVPPSALVDGTIKSIDFAGNRISLARVYRAGVTAAPGETVSYKVTVANGASADSKAAQGVQVADVLPPEASYVEGTLKVLYGGQWVDPSSANWPCEFTDNMLTCGAKTFTKGESQTLRFWATLDDSISTAGLPQSDGHWVDVEHADNTTTLNVGQTRTITALCPVDYMATDGGLLLDQAGSSADVVIESSRTTLVGSANGWAVRATNLGDSVAEVTAEVTCLAVEVGSSGGHTHLLDAQTVAMSAGSVASDPGTDGQQVMRSCPVGWTPYAPEFEVDSGIAVVRESYAVDNTWYWVIDHTDGTDSSFGISCLAPTTMSDGGHTAELEISTPDDTISIPSETQAEGIMACPADSSAIVGGYGGYSSRVRSLGAEQRGDRYMFRFYNEDPDAARNADIQVTCVGSLTTNEPTYKDVVNTAYVTTTTKDRDYTDNSSSAAVAVNGDPAAGLPSGVVLTQLSATRTVVAGKTSALTLSIQCTKANPCDFTVKAFSGATLVASKTTSILALATKNVTVPTNSLGKNLTFGDTITVKLKTTAGTTTYTVGIVS